MRELRDHVGGFPNHRLEKGSASPTPRSPRRPSTNSNGPTRRRAGGTSSTRTSRRENLNVVTIGTWIRIRHGTKAVVGSLCLAICTAAAASGVAAAPDAASKTITPKTNGPAAESNHVEARIAVIGSQTAAVEKLVPLVELRLGQDKNVTLLERENIKDILREQELQALMTAEGTGKRVALGKLLKADLLVLIQEESEPEPHARVVICECNQGLRLCNQPVEFAKTIEADVDAVSRLVEKAVEKRKKPIADIVAVPPFVNNTLAYEGEHLKGACARLIEELLLDQPGVLVVELAEAKAFAQELALTNASIAERRLPLYLMGEYRLDGAGEERKASCTLRLLRGATVIDQQRQDDAALAEMPRLVCKAAAEMFSKSLGQAVQPPNPEAEARQLAERAQVSLRLGDWDEALTLTEAAILLKPQRFDLHGDALHCLNKILMPETRKDRVKNFGDLPPDGPSYRLVKAALPTHLYHMENYMLNTRLGGRGTTLMGLPGHCCERVLSNFSWRNQEEFQRSMADFEPVMAVARRVLAAKSAAKVQDATLWLLTSYADVPVDGNWASDVKPTAWRAHYLKEHLQAIRDRRLKLLQDFAYLTVACHNQMHGLSDLGIANDPTYVDFLRRASEIPPVRWVAEDILKEMARVSRQEAERKLLPAKPSAASPSPGQPPAVPKEASPTSDPEFAVHPIPFRRKDSVKLRSRLSYGLPTIPGVDLFLDESTLYLVKDKDELRPLPLRRNRDTKGENADRAQDICFDGQFIWLLSPGPYRFLAAIDPQTEQIWEYTAEDGLPPMNELAGAAVTPLAPGKICAAGYFGRSWCATAALDPEKGITLKVFHEAREVADSRVRSNANPNVATHANRLFTLDVPARDGKPAVQKVLVFGGSGHVLLIDPQEAVVERVVDVGSGSRAVFCVRDGAVYVSMEGGRPCWLYRYAYPDFKKEQLRNGEFGCVAFRDDRVYMWLREQLWVSANLHEPFQSLRGDVPEELIGGSYSSWRYPMAASHHYGTVVFGPKAYRVELLKR